MTIQEILCTMIFGPVELGCDCVFTILVQRLHYVGLSIVLLSFVMTVVTVPFHQNRTAVFKQQQKERLMLRSWRGIFRLLPEVVFLAASCRYFTGL